MNYGNCTDLFLSIFTPSHSGHILFVDERHKFSTQECLKAYEPHRKRQRRRKQSLLRSAFIIINHEAAEKGVESSFHCSTFFTRWPSSVETTEKHENNLANVLRPSWNLKREYRLYVRNLINDIESTMAFAFPPLQLQPLEKEKCQYLPCPRNNTFFKPHSKY